MKTNLMIEGDVLTLSNLESDIEEMLKTPLEKEEVETDKNWMLRIIYMDFALKRLNKSAFDFVMKHEKIRSFFKNKERANYNLLKIELEEEFLGQTDTYSLIEKKYGVKIYYLSVCPEKEIVVTNDLEGNFFKENYYLFGKINDDFFLTKKTKMFSEIGKLTDAFEDVKKAYEKNGVMLIETKRKKMIYNAPRDFHIEINKELNTQRITTPGKVHVLYECDEWRSFSSMKILGIYAKNKTGENNMLRDIRKTVKNLKEMVKIGNIESVGKITVDDIYKQKIEGLHIQLFEINKIGGMLK